jgi:predicted DCC family thiol-disulfide oxidoreductase YuxK
MPKGATLVFDNQCGFCRRWVDRVTRLDRDGAVRLVPLQDQTATLLTGQPVDKLRQAVHFVRKDGSVFAGAAAARELLAVLPGLGATRIVASVPGMMFLAEQVYAWVARRWGPVPN